VQSISTTLVPMAVVQLISVLVTFVQQTLVLVKFGMLTLLVAFVLLTLVLVIFVLSTLVTMTCVMLVLQPEWSYLNVSTTYREVCHFVPQLLKYGSW